MSNLNNLPSVVAYITDKLVIPFLRKPTLKDYRKVVKLSIEPILRLIISVTMVNEHHFSREMIHSMLGKTDVTKLNSLQNIALKKASIGLVFDF
jgi:hypothetical protein